MFEVGRTLGGLGTERGAAEGRHCSGRVEGSEHVVTACGSQAEGTISEHTCTSCFSRLDLKELKLGLTGMVAPLMEQTHSSQARLWQCCGVDEAQRPLLPCTS